MLDTPKTSEGRRRIPIPALCVRALMAQRARQAEQRLTVAAAWHDEDLVSTTPIGTPIDPANLTKAYGRLCAEAGIGHRRFHAVRHSAATIMLASGTPLEVISKPLGHAGYAITAGIYPKVGDESQHQAASSMDAALAGA